MKLTRFLIPLGAVALSAFSSVLEATPDATGPNSLSRLPVKEVTVFKDGHAFVVHEGALPTNESGSVVLDALPAPVIGTFWTYSTDEAAKVSRVVAGSRRRVVERTALTLSEMIAGNPGAEVEVTETDGTKYPATLIGQPVRPPDEPAVTNVSESPEPAVAKSALMMLKTPEGIKVMPLEGGLRVTVVSKGSRQELHVYGITVEQARKILTSTDLAGYLINFTGEERATHARRNDARRMVDGGCGLDAPPLPRPFCRDWPARGLAYLTPRPLPCCAGKRTDR